MGAQTQTLGVILENAALKQAEPSTPLAPVPVPSPHSSHATASRVVKGEDVMFIHPLAIASQPPSMLYMVCDGHSGVEAANFVAANFMRILNSKLPAKVPDLGSPKEMEAFAELVRRAICETFVRLDNDWIAVGQSAGPWSPGTTVSACIVIGYLMSFANVGDSLAVLDTGCSIMELTNSHRIHNNPEEQARLRGAGCQLAPLGFHLQGPARQGELGVGPMRLWPGGLCVARSVGDLDAGPEVLPLPNVRQVLLPHEGARVIICSDGVWDLMSLSKAVKLCRTKPTSSATQVLIGAVARDLRMMDDASIIVVDFLPTDTTNFPTVALKSNPKPEKKSGGIFACFKPELDEPDSRDLSGDAPGHLACFADIDALKTYPQLRGMLQRAQLQHVATALNAAHSPQQPGNPVDYTMHGSSSLLLYRGYDGTTPRSNSSAAIDTNLNNHSLHSAPSCDSAPLKGGKDGMYGGAEPEYEPIVSFGSAPDRAATTSLVHA